MGLCCACLAPTQVSATASLAYTLDSISVGRLLSLMTPRRFCGTVQSLVMGFPSLTLYGFFCMLYEQMSFASVFQASACACLICACSMQIKFRDNLRVRKFFTPDKLRKNGVQNADPCKLGLGG